MYYQLGKAEEKIEEAFSTDKISIEEYEERMYELYDGAGLDWDYERVPEGYELLWKDPDAIETEEW